MKTEEHGTLEVLKSNAQHDGGVSRWWKETDTLRL